MVSPFALRPAARIGDGVADQPAFDRAPALTYGRWVTVEDLPRPWGRSAGRDASAVHVCEVERRSPPRTPRAKREARRPPAQSGLEPSRAIPIDSSVLRIAFSGRRGHDAFSSAIGEPTHEPFCAVRNAGPHPADRSASRCAPSISAAIGSQSACSSGSLRGHPSVASHARNPIRYPRVTSRPDILRGNPFPCRGPEAARSPPSATAMRLRRAPRTCTPGPVACLYPFRAPASMPRMK